GFAVSETLYGQGIDAIRSLNPITLAGFRDALGVSRRHAQLLLERYDADGLTRRVGDERVLRRAARQSAQSGAGASSAAARSARLAGPAVRQRLDRQLQHV